MSRLACQIWRRAFSTVPREQPRSQMAAWQIHSYGSLSELQLGRHTRIPRITHPDQVLIKVEASSVNPLDVYMIGGYGSTALNLMRKMDNIEFPLTLGRDFCGTIVSKGLGSTNKLDIGSTVWGVVPVHQQGCHAEYVIVDKNTIGPKPSNINVHDAAAILYAGLTAWSGLTFSGGLTLHNLSGLKVLVLGASGGVGNAAVQILHAGGANMYATCSTDAIPLVEALGVGSIFDYTSADFEQNLVNCGRFDLVLDCAGLGSDYATKLPMKFRNYVTFTTPVLKNFDNLGLVRGAIESATNLICPNVQILKNGSVIKWAYFIPSADGIKYLYDLVEEKKMTANVEKIYEFHDLPSAYQRVQDGHLRGKIVVDINDTDKNYS